MARAPDRSVASNSELFQVVRTGAPFANMVHRMLWRTRWVLAALGALGCGEVEETGSSSSALQEAPALEAMGASSQEAALTSNVRPLLLPMPYAAATEALTGPRWFALSYRDPTHTISLHATDVVHHRLDEQVPPGRFVVRGVPARSTVNEGIRAVTWTHENVAYALEVECARPFSDERCTNADYALDLAEQLEEVSR